MNTLRALLVAVLFVTVSTMDYNDELLIQNSGVVTTR